jgi:hypothetical protein
MTARALFRRTLCAIAIALIALIAACATEGGSGVYYGELYRYYDDPWYWGGCCVDPPVDAGPLPPRPEHPIANPPPSRPSQPIATPRPAPMPRAAARGGRR